MPWRYFSMSILGAVCMFSEYYNGLCCIQPKLTSSWAWGVMWWNPSRSCRSKNDAEFFLWIVVQLQEYGSFTILIGVILIRKAVVERHLKGQAWRRPRKMVGVTFERHNHWTVHCSSVLVTKLTIVWVALVTKLITMWALRSSKLSSVSSVQFVNLWAACKLWQLKAS